jgi:hypothetical protein
MALENKNFSVKNGLSIVNTEVISIDRKLRNLTFDSADSNTLKLSGNQLVATAGSATITIPNSTDTLVARNTTDTLKNKTLDDFYAIGTMIVNGSGGTSGQILKATGDGMTWADTFNGLPRYVPYDSDFNAESQGLYLVDTSDNVVEITLPSTTEIDSSTGLLVVEDGEGIEFIDSKGTWGINFVRLIPGDVNASFINSANIEDTEYVFDVSNAIVRIVWDGQYWRVFPR